MGQALPGEVKNWTCEIHLVAIYTIHPECFPVQLYRWKAQLLPVPAHVRLSWWCPGVLQRYFKTGPLEPCTLFENRRFLSSDGHAMYLRQYRELLMGTGAR